MKFKNILAITFALIFVVAFIAPSISAWWIFGNNTGDAKAVTTATRVDANTDLNTIPTSVTTKSAIATQPVKVGVNKGCSGTQSMDTLLTANINSCGNQIKVLTKDALIFGIKDMGENEIVLYKYTPTQSIVGINSHNLDVRSTNVIMQGEKIEIIYPEIKFNLLTGTQASPNAYACLDINGALYRSNTPCN